MGEVVGETLSPSVLGAASWLEVAVGRELSLLALCVLLVELEEYIVLYSIQCYIVDRPRHT